jgi:hypothetical protein
MWSFHIPDCLQDLIQLQRLAGSLQTEVCVMHVAILQSIVTASKQIILTNKRLLLATLRS